MYDRTKSTGSDKFNIIFSSSTQLINIYIIVSQVLITVHINCYVFRFSLEKYIEQST